MSARSVQPRSEPLLRVFQASCFALAASLGSYASYGARDDAVAHAQADPPRQEATLAELTVLLEGFRNDRGTAYLALFQNGDDFPSKPERAAVREMLPIVEGRARLTLRGLRPGDFALSVLHDEDGNHKVTTNFIGIPREGIGFSRDARGLIGPPSFKKAKIALPPGAKLTVSVHMHYY